MRLTLICSFIIAFQCSVLNKINAQSIPASPFPDEITQPDGTKILVLGKGNIDFHHTETVDGYTIVKNSEGIYEYAVIGTDNIIVASSYKAKNAEERTDDELLFLNSISKGLTETPNQKSEEIPTYLKKASQNMSFPAEGTIKVLLLLIEYPDLKSNYTKSDFNNLMNQYGYNNTGSFKEYYDNSSGGKLILETDVYGWYSAVNNYEYYGENNGDDGARELVAEAIDQAEADGVNFSLYDNDKDGLVDGVIVVHSGPGAESGSQTQYVWSHTSKLGGTYFKNYDDVFINDYTINPETRPYGMVGIGVFCHEFGHLLGLPDLYDTDDSNGMSEGIGEWGLMGGGAWLNQERTPSNLCAWSRVKMDWASPVVIYNGFQSLNSDPYSNDVYKILTGRENEYFLLENRQNTGQDKYLPGKGMAVWHIDDNQINNNNEDHKMVDLEEADGRYDLDNENNRGDSGDLYPGTSNNMTFGKDSNPNSNLYSGTASEVEISNITEDNQTITFNLKTINKEPEIIMHYADIVIEEDFSDTILSQSLNESITDDEALEYEIAFNGNSIIAEITENRIKLSSVLNKNGDNEVILSATDGEFVVKDTFMVEVIPVNDYPVAGDQVFEVEENSYVGTKIDTIKAEDPDGDQLTYTISAGNSYNTFILDPSTGIIYVQDSKELDYEKQTQLDFKVKVRDNGEGYLAKEIVVTINILDVENETTGKNDLISNSAIELYPVPVKEKLNVEFSKTITKKVLITLYNSAGKIVKLKEISAPLENITTIDCQDLSSGVYLLKVSSGNSNVIKKIIKE